MELEHLFPVAKLKEKPRSQVPAAHACNPSYSEIRDQEDCGFKASPGKQF
jgi:hypothetical protein